MLLAWYWTHTHWHLRCESCLKCGYCQDHMNRVNYTLIDIETYVFATRMIIFSPKLQKKRIIFWPFLYTVQWLSHKVSKLDSSEQTDIALINPSLGILGFLAHKLVRDHSINCKRSTAINSESSATFCKSYFRNFPCCAIKTNKKCYKK